MGIMKNSEICNWQKISFFNLFVASCLGVLMRYKIVFPLPFINQKFLLESHSHFAFTGWLTQILMALIIKFLHDNNKLLYLKKYRMLLVANLISAYGMLFSFSFVGYAPVSIVFSSLSIFVSYLFCLFVWRDLNALQVKTICKSWFKAALAFNAISSLGAFALAVLMANKIANQNLYLASVYFFLHFQYNGWFFFAVMGLFQHFLEERNLIANSNIPVFIFRLFLAASVPAYFLSALWLPIPQWLYVIIVAAAFAQLAALIMLFKILYVQCSKISTLLAAVPKWLWMLSFIALAIKILLQLGSTIPSLNTIAYGFRPIVIGYLHLIFLGVLTIFLTGFFLVTEKIVISKWLTRGIIIFVAGIIINELLLMLQGVTSLLNVSLDYINECLLATAIIMFAGLLVINRNLLNAKSLDDKSSSQAD